MNNPDYCYAVMEEPGKLVLSRTARTPPPPKKVLIRVAYCGICATDIAIFDGKRRKQFPYLPGHEYSGIVEAVGAEVTHVFPGDFVVGNPNYTCGRCYFCQQQEYHLCDSADEPHYSNGAFADFLTIQSDYVYRIPASLSLMQAALTECVACSLHAVHHLDHRKRNLVLVTGAGTMGLLIAHILRRWCLAEQIIVAEPLPSRREIAAQLKIGQVIGADQGEVQQVIRAENQVGADAVFECAGSLSAVQNALECVRRGGKVVLVGRTDEEATLEIRPCHLARQAVSVVGSSRYTPQEFEQAILYLAQSEIDPDLFFDRVFALEQIAEAFQHVRAKQSIKTLVKGVGQSLPEPV